MLTNEQREILIGYGYQYCPGALAATSQAERDEAMVYAWQCNFEDQIEPLIQQVHSRSLAADGLIGPATAYSLHLPRCGEPDYREPQAAVMEANWPTGCRSTLTWAHRIPSLRGLTQTQIAEGLRAAFKVWSDSLVVGFVEKQTDWPNVHFQERSKNLGGGGVLARHLLAHNRCDSSTWGEYNTAISWTFAMFLAVGAHEIGHGMGFNHVPGSATLMNPAITRGAIERGGKPIDADLAEARRQGYVLRTSPPDDPDDPDIPTGDTVGRVFMTLGDRTIVGERVPFKVT